MKNLKSIFIHVFVIILIFGYSKVFSQSIEKLPAPINSDDYRTVSPYISYDGRNVVFVMQKEDSQKLVECKLNAVGVWEGPFEINAVNNFDSIPFFIESPVYNHDVSELYFSILYDVKETNSDIYVSKKEKGKWTIPEKMPSPINTDNNETDPFLSPDGKQLFFAKRYENEELKKFECYQLYVSEKLKSDWKKPVALPVPVNYGCDRFPRMAADGKTLYFSSVRSEAKTMWDIYYAKKITKNAWTSPVPIDTINNSEDELSPSVPLSGKFVYYQSGVGKKKERTDNLVKMQPSIEFSPEKTIHISGTVKDLKTDNPLGAKIYVIDPNTSIILFKANSNEVNGEYGFFLQQNRKYRIDVFNTNYSHYFFDYDANNITEYSEVKKNIKLFPEIDLIVNIYDSEIYEPLNSNVNVYDAESGDKIDLNAVQTDIGRYAVTLPIGKHYKIEGEKAHFENNSFTLDLRGVIQFSEFERDIELQVKKLDYVINLSDEETGEGVEATVEIVNLTTNERITKTVKTGKDGKLKIKLRDGTRYEINVTPKGYAFYNTTVDLIEEDVELITEAKLTPLRKATKLELNDIIFETNSADLNNSSYEELDRLVQLLINNPQIKIEISAHTDDTGSKAYNLKLSERRAESVKEYLFGKDIIEQQIISKGYGEGKPKYLPFNNDENRAKNRRVELEVIEITN